MKYVFTRNTRPQEGGGFRRGDVVDLVGASLARWLKRGAVEPHVEPPTRQAEPPAPESVPDPPPVRKPVAKRRTTKRIPKPSED